MCIIWRKNMYLIFYSIILYFENQSKTICFASKIKYHNSCRLIHVSRGRSALCSNPLMFSHFPDVEAEVLMAASKAHLTYPVSLWPCAPLCYSSLTLLQPPSFSSDVSGKVHLMPLHHSSSCLGCSVLDGLLARSFTFAQLSPFQGLRGLQPLKITLLPTLLPSFYFFSP